MFFSRLLSSAAQAMAKYRPVVISGPSGVGKSTVMNMLFHDYPECFAFSVSHTTRKPREGEVNGKDYFFVSVDDMKRSIANGEFFEHAQFSGNLYGTSKKAVQEVIDTGKICILDLEEQGVRNVKGTDLNARFVFIKPPSMDELKSRLVGRGTETEDSLQKRLNTAKSALEYAQQKGAYDIIIVNACKHAAYEQLRGYLITDINEMHKQQQQQQQQQ